MGTTAEIMPWTSGFFLSSTSSNGVRTQVGHTALTRMPWKQ